jgi:hypothetical protein
VGDGGAVYVYVNEHDGKWKLQQQIAKPADDSASRFGLEPGTVALSGDTLVVGDSVDTFPTGGAWVYTRSRSTWTEQKKLTPSVKGNYFGTSVAVSGSQIVVGQTIKESTCALFCTGRGGIAYVYQGSGASWSQEAVLSNPANPFGNFGDAVAIDGNTAAVGEDFPNTNGASFPQAFVFQRVGTTTTWAEQAAVNDGKSGDFFGRSVSISGSRMVVGSSSAAYVFTSPAAGQWALQEELVQPSSCAAAPSNCNRFGNSVGVSGGTEIVGVGSAMDGRVYQ